MAYNKEWAAKYRWELKMAALAQYGLVCVHCGFDDPRALQIDHIEDNGWEERKKLGGQSNAGWNFYRWLKKQNWPEGYQTLCANCNAIKHVEKNKRFRSVTVYHVALSRR